jgi:hypothetical protein
MADSLTAARHAVPAAEMRGGDVGPRSLPIGEGRCLYERIAFKVLGALRPLQARTQ